MISNEIVQAAITAYLKADANVIAALGGSADEIREAQWQGTTFNYPAVRVQLQTQIPEGELLCDIGRIPIAILCYSESNSSMQADQIAGIINTALNGKTFTQITSLGSVRFAMFRSQGLISAVREDIRTWRSEATFDVLVE